MCRTSSGHIGTGRRWRTAAYLLCCCRMSLKLCTQPLLPHFMLPLLPPSEIRFPTMLLLQLLLLLLLPPTSSVQRTRHPPPCMCGFQASLRMPIDGVVMLPEVTTNTGAAADADDAAAFHRKPVTEVVTCLLSVPPHSDLHSVRPLQGAWPQNSPSILEARVPARSAEHGRAPRSSGSGAAVGRPAASCSSCATTN